MRNCLILKNLGENIYHCRDIASMFIQTCPGFTLSRIKHNGSSFSLCLFNSYSRPFRVSFYFIVFLVGGAPCDFYQGKSLPWPKKIEKHWFRRQEENIPVKKLSWRAFLLFSWIWVPLFFSFIHHTLFKMPTTAGSGSFLLNLFLA